VGWQEQIAQNAERYRELRQRLSQASLTETSRDGTVKVTVSADGLVTDLVLKERWHPPPLPELAAEIMDCLSRAQARIPDLVRQTMAEVVGTPDAGAHLVLTDTRNKFPEPPPREPARDDDLRIEPEPEAEAPVPASLPRPRPERVGEDDWDERTVLEDL
jgi:hypothetical protein